MDVGLGEYVQSGSTAPWLAAYRLLKKSSPCIPEVAIRMASLPEFDRSYTHVLLYPPLPSKVLSLEERQNQGNFSTKMYGFYCREMRSICASGETLTESFLKWHRIREFDKETNAPKIRGGGRKSSA